MSLKSFTDTEDSEIAEVSEVADIVTDDDNVTNVTEVTSVANMADVIDVTEVDLKEPEQEQATNLSLQKDLVSFSDLMTAVFGLRTAERDLEPTTATTATTATATATTATTTTATASLNSSPLSEAPFKTFKLFLSMAPGKIGGKSGHRRDLPSDLREIKQKGVTAIFCLQEWSELWNLGLADYPRQAQQAGFRFYHLQIKDGSVPPANDLKPLLRNINFELMRGNVLLHCRCGLGRAGTVAACFLVMYGEEKKTAIAKVRAMRPGAVQTKEQEKFIRKFKK